ncbi:hypothetical protein [Acetivibrio cellulolyticus]|uniref:hypothetical protein n=1 Tax=Acetivibrio cellulolyticus TaxID=35830 RepID=UPI0001E2D4FA|nr:hypothetical protein [Acetivibrio cellulolyticus]
MNTYKIAELKLNMKVKGKLLKRQSDEYLSDKSTSADITIDICEDFFKAKQREMPHLSIDECEYIWTGSEFYHKLLDFNGFMLHASAVAIENKAYLFSAKSGTGKSTHTELWQKYFGEDKAVIINDDKPAIRFIDNKFYVYGTPWSGKTDKNLNIKVPLKSIIFIERAETNWINQIDSRQAIKLILDQTLRPKQIEKMDKLFSLLDKLLKTVPIYKMGCNISEDAVKFAYDAIGK